MNLVVNPKRRSWRIFEARNQRASVLECGRCSAAFDARVDLEFVRVRSETRNGAPPNALAECSNAALLCAEYSRLGIETAAADQESRAEF